MMFLVLNLLQSMMGKSIFYFICFTYLLLDFLLLSGHICHVLWCII